MAGRIVNARLERIILITTGIRFTFSDLSQ